jgi:plastocyanin
MKNSTWIVAALSVTGLTLSSLAAAQDVLYAPARSIADQKISVRPWGSGTIAETDEYAPPGAGTTSIRISTRNLFQGGLIVFGKPLDVAADFNDKGNCLQLTYRLADNSIQGTNGKGGFPGAGGGGKGAFPGAGGGGGKGAFPGAGGKGAFPGAGAGRGQGLPGAGGAGPGAPGGRFGGQGFPGGVPGAPGGIGGRPGATGPKMLKTLRFVITTSDGLKSEAYVPAAPAPRGDAWPQVAVPLQAINGFDRTNKVIQSVSLAGDTTATIYVGGLQVINDPTPVTGSILVFGSSAQSLNLAVGDEVDFTAIGYAGSSVLKYTWNFDSAANAEPDAMGQTVKRKFRKPGDYVITLTITDVFGLKKPYTTSIPAKVNP